AAGYLYPSLTPKPLSVRAENISPVLPGPGATPVRRNRSKRSAPRPAKYTEFPHGLKAHGLSCNSCHKFPSANWKTVKRKDAAFPDITDFPQHESCLKCHRQQFFKGNPPKICSVCHIDPGPRNSLRFPFPNPREIFDASPKSKDHVSDFQMMFPHDKHIDFISRREAPNPVFRNAGFRKRGKAEESCGVCHQTYLPQGEGNDEFVTKPPEDLGDRFWLKKGTFKSVPVSHAKCFECHSTDTGILPEPSNCAACHKLQVPLEKTDFDPKIAAAMKINDRMILNEWRKRDSSAKFRHEFSSHSDLECASCHNVLKMNTLDAATKKVSVTSCNMCHITATADDGGILNYEVDERKKDTKFECVKCHLAFGKLPVPDSHLKAIAAAQ
ncbi:MAG: hypothetical protein KDB79_05840, partial [Acidobacteria bacterium]|nr:hypothetical protein [Acidobacteriota bacterium]